MSPENVSLVEEWLVLFNSAVALKDETALAQLLIPDAYWRDVVALDWDLRTIVGHRRIATELLASATSVGLENIELDAAATWPRWVIRAGRSTFEALLKFETGSGRGRGVLRLIREESDGGAVVLGWTLLTALDELKGFEETVGARRPTGQVHSRNFRGPNWLDKRNTAIAFSNREPAVLVVGAGQAGLSIAARLTQLGVDTLVLEKNKHVGDNWRNRYHALTLHNQVHANHLPYMPFPPNWPVYIPKDKLANWFDSYAEAMELNVWTDSELLVLLC